MPEKSRSEVPTQSQPRSEGRSFDENRIARSIVGLRSTTSEDAFTAPILGTERGGSGVVIRDSGLVLTAGYLVLETESIWLTDIEGRVTAGHLIGYDQETGFGLVQALGQLGLPALELGCSAKAKLGDPVFMAGGNRKQSVHARIVAKQEFTGYWEYLLEEAIFTAPAHPSWGGAGLVDQDGKLLGIGSLHLQQTTDKGEPRDINMVVPIDLLPPILDDLLTFGRVNKPPRPWLGVYATENDGKVVVAGVDERAPAAAAGLHIGDVLSAVRDSSIESLAGFYHAVWNCGPAGVEVPIEVIRDKRSAWLRIKSADRNSYFKKPLLH
jgi:S1-C subfamily serine protease